MAKAGKAVKLSKRKEIDWDRVEIDYRTGLLTQREIGALHCVSHVAIGKRAKADGWVKDLSARIEAKAKDLVTKSIVTKEVTKQRRSTENEVVNATAKVIADVVLEHRTTIKRYRKIAASMLTELEAGTDNLELFKNLGTLLNSPDEKGTDKLNELYQKVIALPSRVDSLKKLSEVLKTLIGLERETFNIGSITAETPNNNTADDALKSWNETMSAIQDKIKQKKD